MIAVPREADEIVRWCVAAFMSSRDAAHDELVEILRATGVPSAHHACAMVPIAFGRQILEGLVEVPPTYVLGDRELSLVDDPIYVAAREQARYASREHIEVIGLRSAEVNAVNQALHAGSQPKDLVLGAAVMQAVDEPARKLTLAQSIVDELVRAHGVTLPIETRVFPSRLQRGHAQLQIDFIARHGEREIMESFAGLGETVDAATANAVEKFSRASLHVLLATLVGREHGADQVEWETWRDFELCSGSMLEMWATPPAMSYAALLDAIKAALPELSRELHWFRTFVAISDGKLLGYDALLDNEVYAPVVELLESWPWPASDKAYALRHFFTLVPADRPA